MQFWQTSRYRVDLARPQVMGIVNVTPDSFSDGGRYASVREALAHCEQLIRDGADMLRVYSMKLASGQCAYERFLPGRMCYVPPFWAHRTVNTGDEPLISLCVYPAEAGHNYGDIEKVGFPMRVFKRAGKVQITGTGE